ncbi:hypothetical protein BDM02DRAFT_3112430 [Thelephora ganbajun]|uniref:Uncharacterized protein n=1 Tax=Thelephora ganbajun TaxID=370292 RepID=A0ACB6ZK52_THEGA|nr:hypothetical protein BDM02DRAFT_3112430 [Thelephora ganbajun]
MGWEFFGSPGVRVASFGRGELSAVGLPNNPPDVTVPSVEMLNKPSFVLRAGAEGSPNKAGELPCSPKSPRPRVGCGGVDAVPRLGAGDSPRLPNREGVVPSIDGTSKRGVFAGPGAASVDGVPRENGCIFDKSSFLFCDSGVFH